MIHAAGSEGPRAVLLKQRVVTQMKVMWVLWRAVEVAFHVSYAAGWLQSWN